jgi:hypothetical protein
MSSLKISMLSGQKMHPWRMVKLKTSELHHDIAKCSTLEGLREEPCKSALSLMELGIRAYSKIDEIWDKDSRSC